MKNPFLFIALNNYISKLINDRYIKDISVISEGEETGFIVYYINNKRYKIPPIENPEKLIERTIAGLLIMEGYTVVNALENNFVVSNNNGDTYFVTGNSCSCADRFSPCKHVFLSNWFLTFRKEQVSLLHKTKT